MLDARCIELKHDFQMSNWGYWTRGIDQNESMVSNSKRLMNNELCHRCLGCGEKENPAIEKQLINNSSWS